MENRKKADWYTQIFRLQSVARKVWRDSRTAACCVKRVPGMNVEIHVNEEKHRAKYAHLMRCASVWQCPVCANQITMRRRDELAKVIRVMMKYTVPVMVSYTVRHQRIDPLHDTLMLLSDSWRDLTVLKSWRSKKNGFEIMGYVRALELTWGTANGWHPHYHVIFFLDLNVCPDAWFQEMQRCWDRVVGINGGSTHTDYALKMSKVYDADEAAAYQQKWGIELSAKKEGGVSDWSIASEMTRGQIAKKTLAPGERLTPFGMMAMMFSDSERGPAYWQYLLKEYGLAIRGQRQLVWSRVPDPRKIAEVTTSDDDQESLLADDPDYSIFMKLSPDEWAAVCKAGYQGVLLDAAADGDDETMLRIITYCRMGERISV